MSGQDKVNIWINPPVFDHANQKEIHGYHHPYLAFEQNFPVERLVIFSWFLLVEISRKSLPLAIFRQELS